MAPPSLRLWPSRFALGRYRSDERSVPPAAVRAAVYARNMLRAGQGKRRRRVPAPRWPFAIEREYASDLVAIITDLRRYTDAILEGELAELLESARRDREDALERELVGLRVIIENLAGSVRYWTDTDGTRGSTLMRWSYGYLDGYEGADGEDVDVYLGPNPEPAEVYVVHQRKKGAPDADEWPEYDEDKVMLGWDSADAAKAAYLAQYDDPRFYGGMSVFSLDDFKRRLRANPGRKLTHADPRQRRLRADVGEGRRSRVLMDRSRERLGGSASAAERAAESAARQVSEYQRRQLGRQSEAAIGVDVTPLLADPKMAARIDAFVAENVALITSLGSRTLDELEKLITRAFADGMRASELGQLIAERWGIAERHARLIARDQIGKLNGQITRARHEELGIARFRWLTMRDPKVRPKHRLMEGKVFAYRGEGAPSFFPGQEICCRCGEEPIFDDILAELDALLADKEPELAPAAALEIAPPQEWQAPVAAMRATSGPSSPAPSPRRWLRATAEGLQELSQRTIVNSVKLGGGVNQTFAATLDDGSKAVWKPVTGEDPDLRSNIAAGTYYLREAAAARVAEQLGVADLMPATVAHTSASGPGSLQAFATTARGLTGGVRPFDRESSERMRIFDFIVGNTDRHMGNVLQRTVRGASKPVLIDHGLCFPSGPPDRFIQPWSHIDRTPGRLLASTLEQIRNIDLRQLARTLLDSGIDVTAVQHTLYRAQLIKRRPSLLEVPSSGSARAWDSTAATAHQLLSETDRRYVDALLAAELRGGP